MAEVNSPLLQMSGVRKQFGPVQALDGVDLAVMPGSVHALIGENGAGKSTLMKVLSGAHAADAGEIRFAGAPYQVDGPASAREAGVAMIYQELTLCPDLTVEANITLGAEAEMLGILRKDPKPIHDALTLLGHEDLPLSRRVGELSLGVQQVVEIARALVLKARLIILDEPTSSLSGADSERLFEVIDRLRERGLSIIYISHFLEEVERLCDSYTVLRDGTSVATGQIKDTSMTQIVEQMVGRSVEELYPKVPHEIGETVLEVKDLHGMQLPKGISFSLRRGEILGIAGVVGAGRSETLRAIFGLDDVQQGTISLPKGGASLDLSTAGPDRMLKAEIDLLSENRKEEGLAVDRPLWDNVTLSSVEKRATLGWTLPSNERRAAAPWMEKLRVRHRHPDQPASDLSGGNQQKVALARILLHGAEVLMLDEPTRGIDVGSKQEIYRLIGEWAAEGKSVLVVSSYLPELFGICDTLAVMYRGHLSPVLPVDAWTDHTVMQFATSGELSPEEKESTHE